MYFEYGEREISYLKDHDKRLGEVIDKLGHLEREVESDLFSSIVHHIVGQQISMSAQQTVWKRMCGRMGEISSHSICLCGREELQDCGMTFKKADSIRELAEKVQSGAFDIEALYDMPDGEVIKRLCLLKGVGAWTAEMLMIFCMQRKDVLSYGDLGILRGMRMLYRHKGIDKKLFDKYARRYSPYGTVAGLYLWAVSSGAVEGLSDPSLKNAK